MMLADALNSDKPRFLLQHYCVFGDLLSPLHCAFVVSIRRLFHFRPLY